MQLPADAMQVCVCVCVCVCACVCACLFVCLRARLCVQACVCSHALPAEFPLILCSLFTRLLKQCCSMHNTHCGARQLASFAGCYMLHAMVRVCVHAYTQARAHTHTNTNPPFSLQPAQRPQLMRHPLPPPLPPRTPPGAHPAPNDTTPTPNFTTENPLMPPPSDPSCSRPMTATATAACESCCVAATRSNCNTFCMYCLSLIVTDFPAKLSHQGLQQQQVVAGFSMHIHFLLLSEQFNCLLTAHYRLATEANRHALKFIHLCRLHSCLLLLQSTLQPPCPTCAATPATSSKFPPPTLLPPPYNRITPTPLPPLYNCNTCA